MGCKLKSMILAVVVLACGTAVMADTFGTGVNQFTLDFVNISGATNPSNGISAGRGFTFTGVSNDYRMGTYEITNDQWNKFKDSVGGTVTGSQGGYTLTPTYMGTSVPTSVSWYEAAQFVNYLNTSTRHTAAYKFTGTQGTTNYTFAPWVSGDTGYNANNPYRNSQAFYFLPTENEWMKAAYWNGTSFQTYATKTNTAPTQGNGTNGTGWNFYTGQYATSPNGPWAVGSGSQELNGTYDMMGNVWEWMESPYTSGDYSATSSHGLRGGSFPYYATTLASSNRLSRAPAGETFDIGFRVASVPEPGSITLLACGAIAGLLWWRRKR